MPIHHLATTMIALAATAATAQPAASPRGLTLLQMEIMVPATLPAARRVAAAKTFAADTAKFRACGDALRLADRYKAEKRFTGHLTVRNGIPMQALPPAIQSELRSRPTGHASRVYTGPGALRVLIACTAPVEPQDIDRTI